MYTLMISFQDGWLEVIGFAIFSFFAVVVFLTFFSVVATFFLVTLPLEEGAGADALAVDIARGCS